MLPQKLKEARERLRLSLDKVELFTGIDDSNLHKYEIGVLSPSPKTLKALSKLYDIPLDQLKAWKLLSKASPEVLEYIRQELCR